MVHRSIVFIGILLTCSILSAKTPQQLKTEMDAFLPAGMKVRMVWTNCPESKGVWTVYAYDSDENVIRELTPASLFTNGNRNISIAYISQNGEFVVFKHEDSGVIQKINFDGKGLKKLFDHGDIVCTWKDPSDNTECFVASDLPSPNDAGTWVIGINDQSKRWQISTDVFPKITSEGDHLGSGLSIDGKMFGGFYHGKPGLWPTPNGAFIPAKNNPWGCNFAMRPTTGKGIYEYGHFEDSHFEIWVRNSDGSLKEVLPMDCVLPGADEPQSLYWTNHVNYVTYLMGEGSATNPILFDLAKKQCVALQEGECSGFSCSHRSQNAVLLAKGGTESHKVTTMKRPLPVSRTPQKLYSIDGRHLSESQIGASAWAVRLLRVPVGSQDAGVVVGCR